MTTVRQIGIGGVTVGIIGLDEVFAEVKALVETDEEKLKDMIFEKVKAKNYIVPGQEEYYRDDLFDEYKVYTGQQNARTRKTGRLEIRVYGAGCPRCEQLDRLVMEVIAKNGLAVDYQYVKDIKEMVKLRILASPSLVINGKIAFIGRVPGRKELEKIFRDAIKQIEK